MEYIRIIVSLGIEALRKEPERLQQEAEKVGQKLNQLSLSHYTIFIQNHECVDALKTEVLLSKIFLIIVIWNYHIIEFHQIQPN